MLNGSLIFHFHIIHFQVALYITSTAINLAFLQSLKSFHPFWIVSAHFWNILIHCTILQSDNPLQNFWIRMADFSLHSFCYLGVKQYCLSMSFVTRSIFLSFTVFSQRSHFDPGIHPTELLFLLISCSFCFKIFLYFV